MNECYNLPNSRGLLNWHGIHQENACYVVCTCDHKLQPP